MEGELIISRTAGEIATEINVIKDQLNKQFIYSSIEIGKKLTEAKELVPHGEWGNWLENNVSYKKSTANNLMKIYKEYGSYQIEGKGQAFEELGYTQAIALLGIKDKDERETFIENNNVQELSTRELEKAIKELNDTKKEKELAEIEAEKYKIESEKLKNESEKLLNELKRNEDERIKALNENEEYKIKMKELEGRPIDVIGYDEEKINEINIQHQEAIEKINKEKQQLESKLNNLKNEQVQKPNNNIIKYEIHFEELVKNFENILIDIDNITKDDTKTAIEYSNAVKKLINLMQQRL